MPQTQIDRGGPNMRFRAVAGDEEEGLADACGKDNVLESACGPIVNLYS